MMLRPASSAAPLVVILTGAAMLAIAAAIGIVDEVRFYLAHGGALPRELMLHALVLGAALLLCAAVIMTRRAARRTVQAEAALRESEERLRLIADNVPALISYVDRDQCYRFSNRTYDAWFGMARERMQGRSVADVFGAEAYGRMRGDIERVLGGDNVQFEIS